MARPTILNDQFIEHFCMNLRLSASIETAIAETGCGRESFYRWRRHVREGVGTELERRLMEGIDKSLGETKMRVEYAFSKLVGRSWRALAWWLERKYPREYGPKRRLPAENADPLPEQDQINGISWYENAPVKLIVMKAAKPTEASVDGVYKAFEAISYTWVAGTYYENLDLAPLISRLLTTDDDSLDAPPVAVIADSYWARRFEGNPGVIGKTAQTDGFAVTVVGVSPNFTSTSLAPAADITMANGVRPGVPTGLEARTISWGEPDQASVTSASHQPIRGESVSPTPSISAVE